MTREQMHSTLNYQLRETELFVQRALLDFGLSAAFEDRSPWERDHCLQWIASSGDHPTTEDRVSRLLDALDAEEPLYRLYKSA